MAWQFSDWNLIWRFLELEDLLIDELAFLVDDEVWIHGTAVLPAIVALAG
jgi:hypothetical protein